MLTRLRRWLAAWRKARREARQRRIEAYQVRRDWLRS